MGGSRIKAAAVDEDGRVVEQRIVPTFERYASSSDSVPVWAGGTADLVSTLESAVGYRASRIGLAAPGLAAADGRSVAFLPGRLEGLEGFDWTAFLGRDAVTPVMNDAQAALLGEMWIGAGRGLQDAILLTLGTGVGGAIMSGGRVLHGAIGRAGHLGHICLDVHGAPGITNIPGSLEEAIGECSILRRSKGRFESTRLLVDAARGGDAEAARWWSESVRSLACAIASYINILDPQTVILGGGNAQLGAALFDPLSLELDSMEWRPGGHCTPVIPAALGELAGAIGAARNAMLHGLH
ncbi:MAG: sugar kinase [Candidatus Hydrogenedentota bacterium]